MSGSCHLLLLGSDQGCRLKSFFNILAPGSPRAGRWHRWLHHSFLSCALDSEQILGKFDSCFTIFNHLLWLLLWLWNHLECHTKCKRPFLKKARELTNWNLSAALWYQLMSQGFLFLGSFFGGPYCLLYYFFSLYFLPLYPSALRHSMTHLITKLFTSGVASH